VEGKLMKKVTLYDGREMLVLKDDVGISTELEEAGHHERSSTEFIKTILTPGMKVIEIGANIGYYTFLEVKLVGPEGFVYAIEPVPENYACLVANIEMYEYTNIRPFQVAMGASNSLVKMRTAKRSNTGTMLNKEVTSDWYEDLFATTYKEDITVEQMRLDDFRELFHIPVPDLIRMDVEGYEGEIFLGAQKTIAAMKKGSYLFLELHPPVFAPNDRTMSKLVKNLYSHGFKTKWPIEFDNEGLIKYLYKKQVCHFFFIKE
jgi:FkbM family methyltransferase